MAHYDAMTEARTAEFNAMAEDERWAEVELEHSLENYDLEDYAPPLQCPICGNDENVITMTSPAIVDVLNWCPCGTVWAPADAPENELTIWTPKSA